MSKIDWKTLNMNEYNIYASGFKSKKPSFEDNLSKYKHRMELIRTLIGFIVLGIQIFIVYRLYTK